MTSSPTHLYLYSHTHSPSCKTWTNTALMFLRIETFVSIVLSYQIQFNVLYCVTSQLSHLCHAHYSHLSDNHWYNRNQSKDCHHYQWMIQHLETLSLTLSSLSCVLTHTEVRTGRVSSLDWGMRPVQGQEARGRERPALPSLSRSCFHFISSHNCLG